MQDLVSAKYALDHFFDKPNVVFIDATFHLPNSGRNALEEFNKFHIPKARFFSIDKISDENSDLPHMLPNESFFSKMLSLLGINNNDTVIAYDNSSFFSSARAWWMFKVFGHKEIKIIDGGFKSWLKINGPSSNKEEKFKKSSYLAKKTNYNLCDNLESIMDDINNNRQKVIIDARGGERFLGKVKEPRSGVKSGHIPSSLNLPISSIIDQNTNCLKPINELEKEFTDLGITDKSCELVMTCGSGITACGLAMAAKGIGFKNIKVYDGSWSEWGSSKKTPVEI